MGRKIEFSKNGERAILKKFESDEALKVGGCCIKTLVGMKWKTGTPWKEHIFKELLLTFNCGQLFLNSYTLIGINDTIYVCSHFGSQEE